MGKMLAVALAVLVYTNGAAAADGSPSAAPGPVKLADCGAACAEEQVLVARGAVSSSAVDRATDDAGLAKNACDDDPCFDP